MKVIYMFSYCNLIK